MFGSSYPYWKEVIIVWVITILVFNHLRDGRSIGEWIKDIWETICDSIADGIHYNFGGHCPICGKWYFSSKKISRCCWDTPEGRRRRRDAEQRLAKERQARRDGTYWDLKNPTSNYSGIPPVIHICPICGNTYTGSFCNNCGNPSDPNIIP